MQDEPVNDEVIPDEEIQKRAKLIWEFQGRPEGRDEEIRSLAEMVLRRERQPRTSNEHRSDRIANSIDEDHVDRSASGSDLTASQEPLKFHSATEGETQDQRFRRIAWPHLASLLRTAQYLTGNQDVAEDLVQDAMLKAFRALNSFKDGTNARAWLMTILRRTHIDLIRSDGRRPVQVSLEVDVERESAIAPTSDQLDARWHDPRQMLDSLDDEVIVGALRTLPDDISWTLLLVDVEQLDQQQAANILEIPVGTVKSRAFRGRRMLKELLETSFAGTEVVQSGASGNVLSN